MKLLRVRSLRAPEMASSAGNSRGLIEAVRTGHRSPSMHRLPRVTPAASLKLHDVEVERVPDFRLPRVTPAASLKPRDPWEVPDPEGWSSAGNSRGLIEA